jgi:hypothetical protein
VSYLFTPCELVLLEAGSGDTGIFREPRGRGKSSVRRRYQATTGEHTAGCEDLACAAVNCSVCELATGL